MDQPTRAAEQCQGFFHRESLGRNFAALSPSAISRISYQNGMADALLSRVLLARPRGSRAVVVLAAAATPFIPCAEILRGDPWVGARAAPALHSPVCEASISSRNSSASSPTASSNPFAINEMP